jgi:hypothetical protein
MMVRSCLSMFHLWRLWNNFDEVWYWVSTPTFVKQF